MEAWLAELWDGHMHSQVTLAPRHLGEGLERTLDEGLWVRGPARRYHARTAGKRFVFHPSLGGEGLWRFPEGGGGRGEGVDEMEKQD